MRTLISLLLLVLTLLPAQADEAPTPPALTVWVLEGETDRELSTKVLDFGEVPLGQRVTRRVKIRNDETVPVNLFYTMYHNSEGYESAFSKTRSPSSGPVAPGAIVEVEFLCAPFMYGNSSDYLILWENYLWELSLGISLRCTTTPPPKPIFGQGRSQFLVKGEPSDIHVWVWGAPPLTYRWSKDGVELPDIHSSYFEVLSPTLADVGIYRLSVASGNDPPEISPPVYIGFLEMSERWVGLRKGGSFERTCTATVPAHPDVTLSWQWLRGGEPLSDGVQADGSEVSGAQSATLRITRLTSALAGHYNCRATMHTPEGTVSGQSIDGFWVNVIDQVPEWWSIDLPSAMRVSQPLEVQLEASQGANRFSASGLPRGLVLDSKTGLITGRPQQASRQNPETGEYKPFRIVLRAGNHLGWSEPAVVELIVEEQRHAGRWTGLAARHTEVNAELGGQLDFNVTESGMASGSLWMNGRKHSFKVALDTDINDPSSFQAGILLPRPKATPLRLTLHAGGGTVREETSGAPVAAIATHYCPKYRTGYAGNYNVGFNRKGGLADGFARLVISSTGSAVWTGRAGDGSVFTAASSLGTAEHTLGLHARLDKDQGSLQGFFRISGPVFDVDSTTMDLPLDLFLQARGAGSKDLTFPDGLATTSITAIGQRYDRDRNMALYWGLAESPSPSAYLSFYGGTGSNPAPFNQFFRLLPPSRLLMPRRGEANPNGVSLSLSPTTGLYSGRYAEAATGRQGSFYGMLILHSASMSFSGRGFGQFLLSQNPETPVHVGTVHWMDAMR